MRTRLLPGGRRQTDSFVVDISLSEGRHIYLSTSSIVLSVVLVLCFVFLVWDKLSF